MFEYSNRSHIRLSVKLALTHIGIYFVNYINMGVLFLIKSVSLVTHFQIYRSLAKQHTNFESVCFGFQVKVFNR